VTNNEGAEKLIKIYLSVQRLSAKDYQKVPNRLISVSVSDFHTILAESVGVDDEVDGSIRLALTASVVSGGGIVTFCKQGTSELSASTLAVDVMVSIDEVAAGDAVTHSLAFSLSVD